MIEFNKTIASCPNCGSAKFIDFGSVKHFGYMLNYVICTECRLIIMKNQMTDDRLQKFYKNEYRTLYNGLDQPSENLMIVQKERGQHLAKFFFENNNYKSETVFNYLDIGCSTGAHLEAIKRLYPSAKLYGIEPGDNFRNFCNAKGFCVYESLDELIKTGLKMDVICLSHVLEHIPEPASYLKLLNNTIASDKCMIIIEVPNTIGGHMSFELAHPVCFFTETLVDTCRIAGFKTVFVTEHGITSKLKSPIYLTGIFEKTNEPIPEIHQRYKNAKAVIRQRKKALNKINSRIYFRRMKNKIKASLSKLKFLE